LIPLKLRESLNKFKDKKAKEKEVNMKGYHEYLDIKIILRKKE